MKRQGFLITTLLLLVVSSVFSGCSRGRRMQKELESGASAFTHREFEKAKISFINALRLEPTNAVAIQHLGKIFFSQGQIIQAYPFLLAARSLTPSDAQVRENLIVTFGMAGGETNIQRALYEIDDLLRRDPTNETALIVLGDIPRTTAEAGVVTERLKALRGRNGDQAIYHLPEARLFLLSNNLPQAEATLRKAVELGPNLASAHLQLGKILVGTRRVEEGEVHLRQASELSPPYGPAREFYARYLMETLRPKDARQVIQEINTQAPEHINGWILRAEMEIADRGFEEARAALGKALRQVPDSVVALRTFAQLLLAEKKPAEAIRILEQLVSARPNSVENRYQIAVAHLANNDPNRAIGELNQVMQLDPRMLGASMMLADLKIRQREYDGAVAILRGILREAPKSERAWLLLIRAQRAMERLNDAAESAEAMRREFPRNPAGAFNLGFILRQQTNNAAARKAFEEALRLNPKLLAATEQLVLMDLEAQDLESADRRAQAEIDANPNEPVPWLIKSQVYRAKKDPAKEEAALLQAIRAAPDSEAGLRKLAELYIARGTLDEAIAKLESLANLDERDPRAPAMLGMLHAERKDFAKARSYYERVLKIDPRHLLALNNLAFLLSDHFGQLDEGYRLGLRAREIDPKDPTIADTLGWIEFRRGQYHEALRLIREAAAFRKDSPEINYHLGMAYYQMGDANNAEVFLALALSAEVDFPGKATANEYLTALRATPDANKDSALRALTKRSQDVPTDVINLQRLGLAQRAAGATDSARATFEAALKVNPNSPHTLALLAQMYAMELKQPERALELVRSARALAPSDPYLGGELGRIAILANDPSWAYTVLQESTRRLAGSPQPDFRSDFAWAAFGIGRFDEATSTMEQLAKGAAASPTRDAARRFLALTAFLTKTNAAPPPQDQIQAALQANPEDGAALFALGTQLEKSGKYAEAKAAYERVLGRSPKFPPAVRQLALLYADRFANDAKAFELGSLARDADPQDEVLAAALGKVLSRRGDHENAIRLLNQAARSQGSDPALHYYLGLAYRGSKQALEGRKAFEKAIELAPQGPLAPEAKRYLEELKKG